MSRRSLNPLSGLRLLWWLVRLLRQEDIRLVHGFTLKCAIYGSLAARWAGVAARLNAVTGLGYVFISQAPRARLLRPLVRGLLRQAAREKALTQFNETAVSRPQRWRSIANCWTHPLRDNARPRPPRHEGFGGGLAAAGTLADEHDLFSQPFEESVD